MIRWRNLTIDRLQLALTCRDTTVYFTPINFKLVCLLILGSPSTTTALFDRLYDDRDDGGPLGGTKIIQIFMWKLKPKLRALNLEIRTKGPYGFTSYWIEPISDDRECWTEAAE